MLRESWVEYLQSAHQSDFDEATLRVASSFARLDSRLDFTRQQFNQTMAAIVSNYTNERAALIKRLTTEALQRNPELPLPDTAPDVTRTSSRFKG